MDFVRLKKDFQRNYKEAFLRKDYSTLDQITLKWVHRFNSSSLFELKETLEDLSTEPVINNFPEEDKINHSEIQLEINTKEEISENSLLNSQDSNNFEEEISENSLLNSQDSNNLEEEISENSLLNSQDSNNFEEEISENSLLNSQDSNNLEEDLFIEIKTNKNNSQRYDLQRLEEQIDYNNSPLPSISNLRRWIIKDINRDKKAS